MTTPLKPLTLGELLDRTFLLYRRNFLVFVCIVGMPYLLLLAYELTGLALGIRSSPSLGALLWYFLWLLGTLVISIVAGTVGQAATVMAVSELHLGRPVSIGQVYGRIRGNILQLCFITTMVGLMIGFGFVMFVVPGIILLLRWALVIPVAVLEHVGLWEATARSTALTDGNKGRVFMIYFLFFVLSATVSSVWQTPVFLAAFKAGRVGATLPMWAQVLSHVGAFFTNCLVGPLLTIAIALAYYDERVRREAFDLDHMLAALDAPAASPGLSLG